MVISLDRSFSPEELQEAEEIAAAVEHYIKYSGARIVENAYAIDGKSTQDKDDAIYIDAAHRDNVVVSVYISDLASFLKQDGTLDRAAFQNIATLYGAKKNAPMLPDRLSSDIFSLHADKITPALEIKITLSKKNGAILAIDTDRVLLKPKNLTYEQASEKINKSHIFRKWSEITSWLGKMRSASMQLPFYNYDTGILTDEEGIERYMSPSNYKSYSIVQETMILANHALGLLLHHNFSHGIFRTQAGSRATASTYSELCAHHASLKLDAYTHGTSPLRRYADIIAHRFVSYLGFPFSMKYDRLTQEPNVFRNLHQGKGLIPYTSAVLKTACSYLTQGARWIRNFRKEVFSEKASTWVQSVFPDTDPDELKEFNPGNFSHLLKEAIADGVSSSVFESEIRARINGEGGADGKTALNLPRDHVYLLRMQNPDAGYLALQQEIIRTLSGDKDNIEAVFNMLCQKEEITSIINNGSVAFSNSGKGRNVSFAAIIFEKDEQEFSCGEYSFSVKDNMALARAKLEFLRSWVNNNFVSGKQLSIPAEIKVDSSFEIENAWQRVKKTCNRMDYIIEEKRVRMPNKTKGEEVTFNPDAGKAPKMYQYEMVIRKNNALREVIFRGRAENGDKDEVQSNVRRRAMNTLVQRGDAKENPTAITADSTFTGKPEEIFSNSFSIPKERIIVMSYKTTVAQR